MVFEITREDNRYKKHLKWHLIGKSKDGTISEWFKTEKEALKAKVKNEDILSL